MPERIQRRRTKGWRLPEGAISVTRPGRWGNPWKVWREHDGSWCVSSGSCHHRPFATKAEAQAKAVALYRADLLTPGPHNHRLYNPVPTRVDAFIELHGRDLACFCKLTEPCHADVLLEIAAEVPF